MTPAARIAAAALVLDRIIAGAPAEQALIGWARQSRFAGSGDRAAVRDLVFQAWRRRRSFGALSGAGDAASGRQLMIGKLVAEGVDPASVFDGQGHGPAILSAAESGALSCTETLHEATELDVPDWLVGPLKAALGTEFPAAMRHMQDRAPVFLRVNVARSSVAAAQAALAEDGIQGEPSPLAPAALRVMAGPEKIRISAAYLAGLVEIQDAASQIACDAVEIAGGERVLDYCAGGGGKTLALAARVPTAKVYAHDLNKARLSDLPVRAKRANASITIIDMKDLTATAPYDLVLTDVPCSGSGTWARDPDAKWRLDPARLAQLTRMQAEILDAASELAASNGRLVYMTCSLLREENEEQVAAFIARRPEWYLTSQRRLSPAEGAGGFFFAHLTQTHGRHTTS